MYIQKRQIHLDEKRSLQCQPDGDSSLTNVSNILAAAGFDLNHVVKTTVLLADIADFAAMNAVYAEFFTENKPARACFAVKDLPRGALVEIEAIAAK